MRNHPVSSWDRVLLAALGLVLAGWFAWNATSLEELRLDRGTMFWRLSAPFFAATFLLLLAALPRIAQVNLLIFVGICAVVEVAARVIGSEELALPAMERSADYTARDGDLGYRAIPRAEALVTKRDAGRLVYEAQYSFDDRGRRITPVAEAALRDRFVAVFGCSFAFGEGLEPDATLAAQLGRLAPRVLPLNYGFSGWGPHHMLALLQEPGALEDLEGRPGIGVYVFIDGHVGRATGDFHSSSYAEDSPRFVLVGDRPERRGGLMRDRLLTAMTFSVLGRSQLVRASGLNLPPRVTDAQIELTSALIRESASLFRRKTGGPFYVLFYPGSQLAGRLRPRLDGVGILDYSGRPEPPGSRIEGDGHPSRLASQAIAEAIVDDLGLLASTPVDGDRSP